MKKWAATMLTFLVLLSLARYQGALCAQQPSSQDRQAAKVKAQIERLGTGNEAKIKIELRDKTKLAGYVSKIGPDSFELVDPNSNATRTIAYADVKKLHGNGPGAAKVVAFGGAAWLSKPAIIVVVVLLVVVVALVGSDKS